MKLPFIISVPHAGLTIPDEVKSICNLTHDEIVQDGDEGARDIYSLADEVEGFVTTDIARAFVDLNRPADDFSKDGVIKTHTCYNIPVYSSGLTKSTVQELLNRYYHPYHQKLTNLSQQATVKLGVDCHTMAAFGPPVGPDPGKTRPLICLSNGEGSTCPDKYLESLAECLKSVFANHKISINKPFKGGYITRSQSRHLPWLQLEFSRTEIITSIEKKSLLLTALENWWRKFPFEG